MTLLLDLVQYLLGPVLHTIEIILIVVHQHVVEVRSEYIGSRVPILFTAFH